MLKVSLVLVGMARKEEHLTAGQKILAIRFFPLFLIFNIGFKAVSLWKFEHLCVCVFL